MFANSTSRLSNTAELNTSTTARLLMLPIELRLNIYDMIFTPLATTPKHLDTYELVESKTSSNDFDSFRALFTICRKIHDEAATHFDRYWVPQITLYFDDVPRLRQVLQLISYARPAIRNLSINLRTRELLASYYCEHYLSVHDDICRFASRQGESMPDMPIEAFMDAASICSHSKLHGRLVILPPETMACDVQREGKDIDMLMYPVRRCGEDIGLFIIRKICREHGSAYGELRMRAGDVTLDPIDVGRELDNMQAYHRSLMTARPALRQLHQTELSRLAAIFVS